MGVAGDDEARVGLLQRAQARAGEEEGVVFRRAAVVVVGIHAANGGGRLESDGYIGLFLLAGFSFSSDELFIYLFLFEN